MNISTCIADAKAGKPVYITDVKRLFSSMKQTKNIICSLELVDGDKKEFSLTIPDTVRCNDEEKDFIKSFVYAKIYNILSTFGGRKMTFYCNTGDNEMTDLFHSVETAFEISKPRKYRKSYGKAINVADRMTENLESQNPEAGKEFSFVLAPIDERTSGGLKQKKGAETISAVERFISASTGLDGKVICGMDIGGTDIKIVVSKGDSILYVKEYDWYPASFTQVNQLIDPIILLVRLMRSIYAAEHTEEKQIDSSILGALTHAMDKHAGYEEIQQAVQKAEKSFSCEDITFSAIGLCFPDVVVKNKIVGGEVYKTRGIRNNPEIDYEAEFKQLTHLNEVLKKYCSEPDAVQMTNDGPMAAFTAAVEIAQTENKHELEKGVFAHTLGTELGTGWIDEAGKIPEIPLEIYNFIIDLGSWGEREYEPDDLRSIKNFNTGISGTLQKYTSQSGVFRLVMKYAPENCPQLIQELKKKGFILKSSAGGKEGWFVPTEPQDLRKPFLEYIMHLTSKGNNEICDRIFLEIGKFLAVTWQETEDILAPSAKPRILFGRLVKNSRCFELMQEGARDVVPNLSLVAADDSLAHTNLMKQLRNHEMYTVAQFAQAVGAVYFSNS